jgi:hypothetical protein
MGYRPTRFFSALLIAGLFVASVRADGTAKPVVPEADRIRIAEAIHLANAIGNKVWPEWDKVPFAILLVTPDQEFLIGHPKPTDDFSALGEDSILKQKVWSRKRQFSTNLLATFPAVGTTSTIVVGQAENTESKDSSRWVITLLHEHFHQLQNSKPRYFEGVVDLGLARGDKTGMWMLNFPFPYDKAGVKQQFSLTAKALGDALKCRDQPDFPSKFASYLDARGKLQSLVKEDEWKYFGFQLWQEGIARYTELRLAKIAASGYEPIPEFRNLKDFKPYDEVARRIFTAIEKELDSVELDKAKRTVVYNFGAAEGLVLDKALPDWRKKYFDRPFSLDEYFREAK